MNKKYQGPPYLRPRLKQVLFCMARGDDSRQIASLLNLSHSTILAYMSDLKCFFESENIVECARRGGYLVEQNKEAKIESNL